MQFFDHFIVVFIFGPPCTLRSLQQETCLLSQLVYKVHVTSCRFTSNLQCIRLADGRRTLKMCYYRSCLVFNCRLYDTGISQSSVTTPLRCGGIFSSSMITNVLLILTVK